MKEDHSHAASSPPDRLGGYLAAAFGVCTFAATSDAAIVNLDISSVSGPRAGVSVGGFRNFHLSTLNPELTGRLGIRHLNGGYSGFYAVDGAGIAINGGEASPKNFPSEAPIDGLSTFSDTFYKTVFFDQFSNARSAAFGPGSYLGFRSANGRYGWLEVTWDPNTLMFEILSGAFEDVAGVGIEAGTVAAVPEPAGALGTLGLLSAGMLLRRRQRAA